MSDEEESRIRYLVCLVTRYDLVGRTLIERFSFDQLTRMYNGIGPEWFPSPLRRAINRLHEDFEPVALVHDVMYATGDGTDGDFDTANMIFLVNGKKIADAKYAWFDPRRYIRRHQAYAMYRLCQDFGWSAYKEAIRDFDIRHGADVAGNNNENMKGKSR